MNETMVTVVGNVATRVDFRVTQAGVPSVRFRLAATVRRFDTERGGWTDAHTSFFTVWAWRQLAENVAGSLSVGEPVLVRGRLRVRNYERDGQRHTDAVIDATSVGHDLSLGTSAFHRAGKARPSQGQGAGDSGDGLGDGGNGVGDRNRADDMTPVAG